MNSAIETSYRIIEMNVCIFMFSTHIWYLYTTIFVELADFLLWVAFRSSHTAIFLVALIMNAQVLSTQFGQSEFCRRIIRKPCLHMQQIQLYIQLRWVAAKCKYIQVCCWCLVGFARLYIQNDSNSQYSNACNRK